MSGMIPKNVWGGGKGAYHKRRDGERLPTIIVRVIYKQIEPALTINVIEGGLWVSPHKVKCREELFILCLKRIQLQ